MARAVSRQRVSASGMRNVKCARPSGPVRRSPSHAAVSTTSRRGRSSTLTPRSCRAPRAGGVGSEDSAMS